MSKSFVLWCALLLGISTTCFAQPVISGSVLDGKGVPLADCVVEAIPMNTNPSAKTTITSGPPLLTTTGADGRFKINVAAGRYRIAAKNEPMGYPDPTYLVNSDPSGSFPFVTAEQDVSGVVVKLGTQGGVITGEVKSSDTNSPIPRAKITVRDLRNGSFAEYFADDQGRFSFAIPARPVLISADAPGYSRSVYQNGSGVSLSGGDKRTITLTLLRR
jgi:Carboxypeptidase regulatory-like domain